VVQGKSKSGKSGRSSKRSPWKLRSDHNESGFWWMS